MRTLHQVPFARAHIAAHDLQRQVAQRHAARQARARRVLLAVIVLTVAAVLALSWASYR